MNDDGVDDELEQSESSDVRGPGSEYMLPFGDLAKYAVPNYTNIVADIAKYTAPDYSSVLANLATKFPTPNYTNIIADIVKNTAPDYSSVLANLATKFPTPNYSAFTLNVAARTVARQVLADSVDAETRAQDCWRDAANEWINRNALALVFWMISGVVTIIFCMTAVAAPDLVDAVNRALSTPLALAGLVLAIYAVSKQKS